MEENKYRKINHHQKISPMCGGEDIEQSSLSMVFQDNIRGGVQGLPGGLLQAGHAQDTLPFEGTVEGSWETAFSPHYILLNGIMSCRIVLSSSLLIA